MRMHGGCGRGQRAPFGSGGPFGWIGGGPFGWPGGGGPRARRGNVRAAILSLLAEQLIQPSRLQQEILHAYRRGGADCQNTRAGTQHHQVSVAAHAMPARRPSRRRSLR